MADKKHVKLTLDQQRPIGGQWAPGVIQGYEPLGADMLAWEIHLDTARGKRVVWYLTSTSVVPHSRLWELFNAAGIKCPKTVRELAAFSPAQLVGVPCQAQLTSSGAQLAYPEAHFPVVGAVIPKNGCHGGFASIKAPEPPPLPRREQILQRLRELTRRRETDPVFASLGPLTCEERDLQQELGALEAKAPAAAAR
jgi:hypothetical protein